jgi:hypothetical protein
MHHSVVFTTMFGAREMVFKRATQDRQHRDVCFKHKIYAIIYHTKISRQAYHLTIPNIFIFFCFGMAFS